jgi:hypothetical protein
MEERIMTTATQIARLEDDNNAIQVGWATGEGADGFAAWLAQHEISTDEAYRLLGLDEHPVDSLGNRAMLFSDVRPSDAASLYGGGSEAAYWWDLDDGSVVGIANAGAAYRIPSDAEPPEVTVTEIIESY